MTEITLIGLHGRYHSGKDSTFNQISALAEPRGLHTVRRAFADALKFSGLAALGLPLDLKLADSLKETGAVIVNWRDENGFHEHCVTGRQLWQYYGTEAHRADDLGHSFGHDFWVDNLLPDISLPAARHPGPRLDWHESFKDDTGYADVGVITDVRFANEAKRIRALGGQIWYIDAEERLGPNPSTHDSESKLPDELIDVTLNNSGPKADLQAQVQRSLGY